MLRVCNISPLKRKHMANIFVEIYIGSVCTYCVRRPDIISILLLMDINYTPSRHFVLNI